MGLTHVLSLLLVLVSAGSAFAQGEWIEYANREDGFLSNFPSEPKVEAITWTTSYGYTLPAKVFRADKGRERYSVTVVDYRGLEQLGIARAKACPAGAETCLGNQVGGPIGDGYWRMDLRGAMANAIFRYIQRPGKVTELTYQFQELVEGYVVHLTTPDESRTIAYITMHEGRLYIWEGTVPKGSPEPGLFMGSVGFSDADGNRIRYQTIYSQAYHGLREYPLPARAGQGGGGGRQGGGRQGGAAGGGAAPQGAGGR